TARASVRRAGRPADRPSWCAGPRTSSGPSFASQVRAVAEAGNHLGLDRQLHRGTAERLGSQRTGNAVQFEQNPARLHASGPVFDRALTLTLTNFGRLLRNRHVREHADPQASLTLDVAGDRAAGRFDLARGDPLGLHGLEAIGAEVQRGAALGVAVNPALARLAELHPLRLEPSSYPASHHQPVLRHRIVGEDLALEDPALDADHAVSGVRFGFGIIDVRAQRVQRHAAFAVPLDTGDFRTAETATTGNPDPFGPQAQRGLH